MREAAPDATAARHRLIPLDAAQAWDRALEGIPHGFAHTRASCLAMMRTSGLPTFLYEFAAEGVRIVCPLSERPINGRTDVVTPYGFSGFAGTADHPAFAEQWLTFARAQGWVAGYIGLNPLFENPSYFPPGAVTRANDLFVIDLTRSPEKLHAALDHNRRRQLRRWDELRDTIITDREPLAAFFRANCREFLRRANAGPAYALTDETLALLAELDNVLLLGRGRGGRIEAVSVFAHTPHAAEYLFNIPLADGRHHAVPLVWYAVHELKARGIPALNLGGGVRPGDGIAQFKERFGARRLPFGALKQVYDEAQYARICRAHGRDPLDRTGYFPAYREPA